VIVTAALFALSASMRSARVTHPVEEVTVSGA
jgi:hypothetical protein